jgi:hypothetical protein
MSEVVYTFAYVMDLLNKVNPSHRLSFSDFQIIMLYLFSKLNNLINLKLKKEQIKYNISIINSILSVLDMIIDTKLIENEENKDLMLKLLEEYNTKLRSYLIGQKHILEVI